MEHLINAVDFILQVFTFSIFPFFLINKIGSLSLQLNKSLPKLIIFRSQRFKVLFNKPLAFLLQG